MEDLTCPQARTRVDRAVSANGVLGDPSGASAGEGEQLLAAALDELCTWVGAQ